MKNALKMVIGVPLLYGYRLLHNCMVYADRHELDEQWASCGTDLCIAHPWDIRGACYVSIGNDTFIGPGVLMIAEDRARIHIGSKVMLGPHVHVIANDHRVDDPSVPIKDAGYANRGDIVIESGVWIGAGATILKCVSIGQGAVIGAGAVLTKSVAPYEIWAGNPARKVRSRLDARPVSTR